ncbi:hypothetical protein LTR37_014588 [Vermiconidia calcicola]|uniref:Uncharacterized protein n=1 Tax=Vermiconidia calcicola TaxID=1690605 RepID=A0ACC3MTF0_9PEZI|nr:hypothetical protein LTR37_014588 [Vermiconidia calcicola]
MALQPPKKKRRITYGDTVAVYVGAEKRLFTLHESVVLEHSKFFRAALTKGFKEGQSRLIHLPEIETPAFEAYIQWMYSHEIVINECESVEEASKTRKQYSELIELYVVGDRLENTNLRNEVMTALVQLQEQSDPNPGCKNVSRVYKETPESSPLRRFVLDSWLDADPDEAIPYMKYMRLKFPTEFIFDMALELFQGKTRPAVRPVDRPKCFYHEHNDETPACE